MHAGPELLRGDPDEQDRVGAVDEADQGAQRHQHPHGTDAEDRAERRRRIWASTPARPPSVTSTLALRWRICVISIAASPNDAALTKNTTAGEAASSSTAPIAGPTITTRLSIVDCSALAATSSPSGTSVGTVALTAGISTGGAGRAQRREHTAPEHDRRLCQCDHREPALPDKAEGVCGDQQPEAIGALDQHARVGAQQQRRQHPDQSRGRDPAERVRARVHERHQRRAVRPAAGRGDQRDRRTAAARRGSRAHHHRTRTTT